MVGENYHLVSVLGVSAGVAHGAAGDSVVLIPAVAVGVAVGITGGGPQKGYVDMELSAADGRSPAAVAAEYYRAVHKAPGDLLRQVSTETGGFYVSNNAAFDVIDKGSVDGGQ